MSDFGNSLDEMDVEAFMNIRDWMEEAIKAKGGVITDAGIGMGAADLGFEVDGAPFGVSIRPRQLTPVNLPFDPNNIPEVSSGKVTSIHDKPEE